ncbi:HepT-like ribonuclease domain-containing protein [Vulcanococcus sp.]
MAGLRDVLAHAYFGLEDETIWQIVSCLGRRSSGE